jgi:DNA-binding GntR family transcriptional regulator
MIRARDEARVVTAIEQHLEASYQRVLASYPDKATELRLLR